MIEDSKKELQESRRRSYTSLHEIKTEPRRWFILLGFFLFSFSNEVAWSAFTLVLTETEAYYGIGSTKFMQFSNIYFYFYIVFCYVFSSYLTDYFAPCLMIATSMNTIGGFLRWYAGNSYAIALTGQGFASLAQGCILQVPAVIAERWFGEHERFWALVVAVYGNYLGWAFGSITSCFYMEAYPFETAFPKLLLLQMILMAIPTIILAFTIRNKPQHPPNIGALVKNEQETPTLATTMKILLSNERYVLNMLCIGFATGVSYTVTSVSSYILKPRNYTNIQLGYIGIAFLGTGIIGAFVGTTYLEARKSTNYDGALRITFTIGLIGLIGLAIAGGGAAFWLVLLLNMFAGLGYISFTPFATESLIETSFPHPEGIAVGNALVIAQVFGLIMNELATWSIVGSQGYWILAALSAPVTIYVVLRYKTEFKRTTLEHEIEKDAIEEEPMLDPNQLQS